MDTVLVEHGIGAGLPIKSTVPITKTPTTSDQVLSKGQYLKDITVKGDANLIPSNIISGKSIFGVTGEVLAMNAGDNLIATNGSSPNTINTTSYAKVYNTYKYTTNAKGSVRIKFDMASSSDYKAGYGRIYKNGLPIGTERYINGIGASYTTYTEDFMCEIGDYFEIYTKAVTDNFPPYIRNYSIYGQLPATLVTYA